MVVGFLQFGFMERIFISGVMYLGTLTMENISNFLMERNMISQSNKPKKITNIGMKSSSMVPQF